MKMLNDQTSRFSKKAHIRYSLRHLRMLPTPYESDDNNRVMFSFFALNSLSSLGALDQINNDDRKNFIDWIYDKWDNRLGGFYGGTRSDYRELGSDNQSVDQPHLTHTYTALLVLAALSLPTLENKNTVSPFGKLDISKLLQFVKQCQNPDGSFSGFPVSAEKDVRFVYCAAAILSIVNVDPNTVIDVKSTVQYIRSCRTYEGGYGQGPFNEAQGGTTYCALASLALLKQLESGLDDDEANVTFRWLSDRQAEYSETVDGKESEDEVNCPDSLEEKECVPSLIAGFQGRIGKPLDTCYSFWCMAAMSVISTRKINKITQTDNYSTVQNYDESPQFDMNTYCDPIANIEFLLKCQSKQWGGICKKLCAHPDIYHNYLALASLSLSFSWAIKSNSKSITVNDEYQSNPLEDHDPLLNVPVRVTEWVKKCFAESPSSDL
ncbi:terpenoid cyclases/protein prenyltransferase alpha-alpha toroid [Phakopsora pachyrhizi]|nr:terpenoid cyclases/protein prenyltransferase alpha-alpha toroid [Phakopsora pachyrhizi]